MPSREPCNTLIGGHSIPQYAILKIIFNSCRFSLGNLYIKLLFHISEMKRVRLLMSSLLIVVSAQQCRSTYSTKVRYLKGHVISAHNVKDHGHCLILCLEDQRCRSTNFEFRSLVCELNDADRHTHPWDYEFKDGYTYSDHVAKVSVRSNVCMFTLNCCKYASLSAIVTRGSPVGFFNLVIPTKFSPQSRNPDGFYRLMPPDSEHAF